MTRGCYLGLDHGSARQPIAQTRVLNVFNLLELRSHERHQENRGTLRTIFSHTFLKLPNKLKSIADTRSEKDSCVCIKER
jgi:hypothetical protein